MNEIKLYFIVCFCLPISLIAQSNSDCMKNYDKLITEAKKLTSQSKPDFEKALKTYAAARIVAKDCGVDKNNAINTAISALFIMVDKQRKAARFAEQKAETALKETIKAEKTAKAATEQAKATKATTEKLLEEVAERKKATEAAKAKADVALEEAQAKTKEATVALEKVQAAQKVSSKAEDKALEQMIKTDLLFDRIVFYEGTMAIAKDQNAKKFGVINKEGKTVVDYQYSTAPIYDKRVRLFKAKKGEKYYFFRKGEEYLAATSLEKVTDATTCLELSLTSNQVPEKVFDYPNLKVLILKSKIPNSEENTLILPESLGKLSQLKYLYIDAEIEVKGLPTNIGALKQLQLLSMHTPDLLELPASISNCQQLKVLTLTSPYLPTVQSMNTLPSNIGAISNLEALEVSRFKGKALPESICQLKQLKYLVLKKAKELRALPDNIGQLTSLKMLDLQYAKWLFEFPESIVKLTQLRTLNLRHASLSALPSDIGNLKQLVNLDISSTNLKVLPESIGALEQLEVFNINGCDIKELTFDITKWTKLRELNIAWTDLEAFPKGVDQLGQLENLQFAGLNLKTYPIAIHKLKRLRKLGISVNEQVPASIVELTNLRELMIESNVLATNELTEIPASIGQFPFLNKLVLSCSKVTSISPAIGNLSNLEYLEFLMPSLTTLPSTIGQLKNLGILVINVTDLEVLPKELSELTSLRILDLYGNELLTTLPASIVTLPALSTLDLSGCNSFERLPENMQNLKKLTAFYFNDNRKKISFSKRDALQKQLPNYTIEWDKSYYEGTGRIRGKGL